MDDENKTQKNEMIKSSIINTFKERYSSSPDIVLRAPGRVNLIGEHTDYNEGFVLPMAIDRSIWIALKKDDDKRVSCFSIDFDQYLSFSLINIHKEQHNWIEYLKGVAWHFQRDGYATPGWQGVLVGDVPNGAGLSSSAALEIATALAFTNLAGNIWDAKKMALLCQRVENEWLGLNTGIMDQMISAAGVKGHGLLIDCRSLETTPIPLPKDTSVLILDTATRRGLVGSAYNDRRKSCEEASRAFGIPYLRDIQMDQFEKLAPVLDDVTYRRAKHIVSENERTLAAASAMKHGNAEEMGRLMKASHASMRDDFEISTDKMNLMVELANIEPDCYGARMTGGGFGGCAVALVDETEAGAIAARVIEQYNAVTGLSAIAYVCQASNGAEVVQQN